MTNPLPHRIDLIPMQADFDASDSAVFQCFDFQICPTIVVLLPCVVCVDMTPVIYTLPAYALERYACEYPVAAIVGQEMLHAIAIASVSDDPT